MSNSQVVIDFVKRRKSNLIKVFNSKCCICGFDKWQSALEFHHVNPEIKDDTIAKMASNHNKMEDIQKEIDKCVILCYVFY